MSDDLVRDIEARDFDEEMAKNLAEIVRISVQAGKDEAATALTEARAEIERRDAFIKELSDALLSVRPLGGSELFVQRCGNYYADPVYCKAAIEKQAEDYHNAMKANVRNSKRADAAESALAEAVFLLDCLTSNIEQAWPTLAKLGPVAAARAFIQQHEGKK